MAILRVSWRLANRSPLRATIRFDFGFGSTIAPESMIRIILTVFLTASLLEP